MLVSRAESGEMPQRGFMSKSRAHAHTKISFAPLMPSCLREKQNKTRKDLKYESHHEALAQPWFKTDSL